MSLVSARDHSGALRRSAIGWFFILAWLLGRTGSAMNFATAVSRRFRKPAPCRSMTMSKSEPIRQWTERALGGLGFKEGVKIDNLVQIAHNVTIGRHSVICAQVGISGKRAGGKLCDARRKSWRQRTYRNWGWSNCRCHGGDHEERASSRGSGGCSCQAHARDTRGTSRC